MKKFDIPLIYQSGLISRIKEFRKLNDPRKVDYSPTELDFGPVKFLVARHFGFCYGVENAIDIAYKTIEENRGKRIYLLSEMIHNPEVNNDLTDLGVKFIMDTFGKMLIDWNELSSDDIVIIPAFGTTMEIEEKLNSIGINPYRFNTTCPFVEKVWNRSSSLGNSDYTVIIHGKHYHEETRSTFSHTIQNGHAVIIRDLEEAKILSDIILGNVEKDFFYEKFNGRSSSGFDVERDLVKVGIVNQTTMLASETEDILKELKTAMIAKYGDANIDEHFADTRDTLCYATNDNQKATLSLLELESDLAIVVGGYNSSNTSHIVELLNEKLQTYFISSPEKIISRDFIQHFLLESKSEIKTENYLPRTEKINIMITSGASCPDSIVEKVISKILSFFPNVKNIDDVFLN
ncbi:MAG: 4-hydroxy-3-methylbut-2-enyl diphosphate reductase [Bacteroidetes bacterium]|nr:4-hydroxy-3-methylbut-2-enyl diphosphate reductase [Bacteroidota bacterium]MBU1678796.1 4-hydroxy-3-methylbut-2-enyl diphosphate reductase [Bacteroidota bacterium]MBU2507371.1 4-hydroxy-3-methylbut-2-enyl diphosphate reductase [Bacteroidota bacterium]